MGSAGHCGTTTDRQDEEAVAECAAYLVVAHHGIDTSAYSFGDVAASARDLAVFKRNISFKGSLKLLLTRQHKSNTTYIAPKCPKCELINHFTDDPGEEITKTRS